MVERNLANRLWMNGKDEVDVGEGNNCLSGTHRSFTFVYVG